MKIVMHSNWFQCSLSWMSAGHHPGRWQERFCLCAPGGRYHQQWRRGTEKTVTLGLHTPGPHVVHALEFLYSRVLASHWYWDKLRETTQHTEHSSDIFYPLPGTHHPDWLLWPHWVEPAGGWRVKSRTWRWSLMALCWHYHWNLMVTLRHGHIVQR